MIIAKVAVLLLYLYIRITCSYICLVLMLALYACSLCLLFMLALYACSLCLLLILVLYAHSFAIFLATCTPLAEAWDREWVMPLPSPIM